MGPRGREVGGWGNEMGAGATAGVEGAAGDVGDGCPAAGGVGGCVWRHESGRTEQTERADKISEGEGEVFKSFIDDSDPHADRTRSICTRGLACNEEGIVALPKGGCTILLHCV